MWIEEADGVFRGGGVKGLGLAGALLGFAESTDKPVKKWVNVAGASAGAIIACYLATGHDAQEMVDLMKKTSFAGFQDFPRGGEYFGGVPNLFRKHGLARGEKFRTWFNDTLEKATFATTKIPDSDDHRLKLIACDATNRALLVLPDDLVRYRLPGQPNAIVPDEFEIASAARMSMSIPYFFEPVLLVRDRVFVQDLGDTAGLVKGVPNDRLDVDAANKALGRERKGCERPRADRRRAEAAGVGHHRRRHAVELPGLALRRRHAEPAAAPADVRLHAHRRQGRRRRAEQRGLVACRGRSASASTSSTRRRRRGTSGSCRTRRACARSRSTPATSARRSSTSRRPTRTC